MRRRTIAAGCLLLMVTAPCLGQSINIDFGSGNGAAGDDYAAAGLAGHWNVLDGPIDTPTFLDDLDGVPTGVFIVIENGFDTLADVPFPHPELGDDRSLLNDGLLGAHGPKIPLDVTIGGLAPGVYRLITYTWYWPVEMFAQVVFVDDNAFVHPAGGPWPGALALGVTHMEHVVQFPPAANVDVLHFILVGDGPGSFYNGGLVLEGIQLWQIDGSIPCPTDFDGDGATGTADLLALLSDWGPCAECPSDLNGDGVVATADLLTLLSVWGPCPGSDPAFCGKPDLGDCYSPHVSPGCSDSICCSTVCGLDAWCCDVEWDALCAGRANLTSLCADAVHPNCGNAEAGSCFEANVIQGCDDPACCQTVCGFDPFCCRYAWDTNCTEEAGLFCSKMR